MVCLLTCLCVCVRERKSERKKEGKHKTMCTSFFSRAPVVLQREKKRKQQCSSLRVLEWRVNVESMSLSGVYYSL